MGIHAHDKLLGGTHADRLLAKRAELKHAKELAEEPPVHPSFAHLVLSTAPDSPGRAPFSFFCAIVHSAEFIPATRDTVTFAWPLHN